MLFAILLYMLPRLIVFVFIATLYYFTGVLMGHSFDPFAWSLDVRIGIGSFHVISQAIGQIVVAVHNDMKKSKDE